MPSIIEIYVGAVYKENILRLQIIVYNVQIMNDFWILASSLNSQSMMDV